MKPNQIIASVFVAFSLTLLAFRPEWTSATGVGFSALLFSVVTYFEQSAGDDLTEIKAQVKTLKERIDGLVAARALGR